MYILIACILFVLIMMGTFIMSSSKDEDEEDKDVLSMRKRQSFTNPREFAIKKKLEGLLEQRVEVSKKFKIESLILQAGFKMTYGEYRILTILMAVAFPLVAYIAMRSIFILPVVAIIGFALPGQVIEFLRNKRMDDFEKQVGSFIKLAIERYSSHGDFAKGLKDTTEDFKGQEPMYSELKQMRVELDLGKPVVEVLQSLHRRVGNKYLLLLAEFYDIAHNLGTEDARNELMGEVFSQYKENQKHKSMLRKEIAGPKRDAYIMMAVIPIMMGYQFLVSDEYPEFMLHTTIGQIGLAGIGSVIVGSIWFINKKIGAPLE
ncbi:type II secretion system F family protein [Rossellomorea marisflavi]|uniref:type II secretion system F family protein n=1 Tax=Rossellomorea marisflavi TaxID=189381 RepID=UPI003FA118F9